MKPQTILYLHGFASSAQGAKAMYFRERFERLPQVVFHAVEFNPTPVDFEYLTITGLINRVRQYLLDHIDSQQVSLVGSSLGGLVALHYAHRYGGVVRMLLMAPALAYRPERFSEEELQRWEKEGVVNVAHYAFEKELPLRFDCHRDGLSYLEPVPPAAPSLIIHGRGDEVVPLEDSRRYAADFPDKVRLVEVDSDHGLNDHLDFIWQQAEAFLS